MVKPLLYSLKRYKENRLHYPLEQDGYGHGGVERELSVNNADFHADFARRKCAPDEMRYLNFVHQGREGKQLV